MRRTVCVCVLIDVAAQQACRAGEKCTGVFDILAKSTQYGVWAFTRNDYNSFCL